MSVAKTMDFLLFELACPVPTPPAGGFGAWVENQKELLDSLRLLEE